VYFEYSEEKSQCALQKFMECGPKAAMNTFKAIQESFREIYRDIVEDSGRAARDGTANFTLYGDTAEFGHDDSPAGPYVRNFSFCLK